jgi:hypothetical protein
MTSFTGSHLEDFIRRYVCERSINKKFRPPDELLIRCNKYIIETEQIIKLIDDIYTLETYYNYDIYKININQSISQFYNKKMSNKINNWLSLKDIFNIIGKYENVRTTLQIGFERSVKLWINKKNQLIFLIKNAHNYGIDSSKLPNIIGGIKIDREPSEIIIIHTMAILYWSYYSEDFYDKLKWFSNQKINIYDIINYQQQNYSTLYMQSLISQPLMFPLMPSFMPSIMPSIIPSFNNNDTTSEYSEEEYKKIILFGKIDERAIKLPKWAIRSNRYARSENGNWSDIDSENDI